MIYEFRGPKKIEPSKKYPAIFVMHGMGSNEQDILAIVNGLEEHFLIFSIRGDLRQGMGFAYFTIQDYGKPNRMKFDQAVNNLNNFIDYASNQYAIDLKQIYLLGFSQGAILAMTLGLKLAEKIKGVIALSGYVPSFVKDEYDVKSVNKIHLFISHGKLDQALPYEWGEANYEYFKGLGANVTFNTYEGGHTVSSQNIRDYKKWLLNLYSNKKIEV